MRLDLRTVGLSAALAAAIAVPLIVIASELRRQPAGMVLSSSSPAIATLRHPGLEAGLAAAEAGRLEDAARLLAEVPPGHPSFVLALQNLAAIRERFGELDDAERLWRDAMALRPNDPIPYVRIAGLRHREGDEVNAELWALRGVEVAPGDPAARYAVALYRLAGGRAAESIEAFARAVERDPGGRQIPQVEQQLDRLAATRPDAYFALAYFANLRRDRAAERDALERYLSTEAEGPLADAARAMLAASIADPGGADNP
jgi:tetratricopeptide (TPR) repeat protein